MVVITVMSFVSSAGIVGDTAAQRAERCSAAAGRNFVEAPRRRLPLRLDHIGRCRWPAHEPARPVADAKLQRLETCVFIQYDATMSANPPMPRRTWVAACSHRLQRRWLSIDPAEVEDLAATLWLDARLRELEPTDAAAEWLRPVHAERPDD
jgi:hypothetical protein